MIWSLNCLTILNASAVYFSGVIMAVTTGDVTALVIVESEKVPKNSSSTALI